MNAGEPYPPHGSSYGRLWELALLLSLVIVACTLNIVWITEDTRPHPFNDAYPKTILNFVDNLDADDGPDFASAVSALSIQGRSPFFQLLNVPFVLAFGRSVDAMLMVNIGFLALLLFSVYGIGRIVKDGRVGLLAAFFVATYPSIVNLSHIARPNFALPACVAFSLWLLFSLTRNRSIPIAWLFGVSLGFGILMRHFFFFHVVAPCLLIGFYLVFFQTEPRRPPDFHGLPGWLLDKVRDPFVLFGLMPGLLITIAMSAGWYLSDTGIQFWALASKVQNNVAPVIRGFGDHATHSFWWYAQTASGAISNVFVLFFLFGVVMAFVKPRLLSVTLVIVVAASYAILSLQKGLGWHRLAAVLPAVALVSALGLFEIRAALLRRLLIAAAITVATFNYSAVMWGLQSWSRPIAIALGSPAASVAHGTGHSDAPTFGTSINKDTCSWRVNAVYCPDPPRDEDWRLTDIATTVLDDRKCAERACRVMFVSETEDFNNTLLTYYILQDLPSKHGQVLAYRASLMPYARPVRPDWMDMDYIIYIPEWSGYRIDHALTRFLDAPPAEFEGIYELVESYSLPTGWTARLMRRTREVSGEEAGRMTESLGLRKGQR